MAIDVIEFSDPGCPWAYSANPALSALRWRYGDQLSWRLAMIGLTEQADQYVQRGYTPARSARGYQRFARWGQPFTRAPKARMAATARMCRAVVATRLAAPELEHDAFRALQFGQFTTTNVMDEDASILAALRFVDGLDAEAIVAALDAPEVTEGYEADRAEARTAEGGATHFQGKHASSDGPVRYTAPSLILSTNGSSLEGGGFQSLEAYDVLIANLDRTLERRPAPEDPLDALRAFPHGLTTAEVAEVMKPDLTEPDFTAAEAALIDHAAEGRVERVALGDDALWRAT
jgi:protein-disulfide isomerase-like protein with CxxC motif